MPSWGRSSGCRLEAHTGTDQNVNFISSIIVVVVLAVCCCATGVACGEAAGKAHMRRKKYKEQ